MNEALLPATATGRPVSPTHHRSLWPPHEVGSRSHDDGRPYGLEAYGFTEHLREIRSFHKLSGEGMTLVGSEMITILEEVLPRFRGSPLDHQLLEEEDERRGSRGWSRRESKDSNH